MLTKPVRTHPCHSRPPRYAKHGFTVSALYLYFVVIALNTVVWWALTFPRTIRNVRGILVINAFISAFYGLFPLMYLIAVDYPVWQLATLPYTGVDIIQKLPERSWALMFLDSVKEAGLGGSASEVAWKVRRCGCILTVNVNSTGSMHPVGLSLDSLALLALLHILTPLFSHLHSSVYFSLPPSPSSKLLARVLPLFVAVSALEDLVGIDYFMHSRGKSIYEEPSQGTESGTIHEGSARCRVVRTTPSPVDERQVSSFISKSIERLTAQSSTMVCRGGKLCLSSA